MGIAASLSDVPKATEPGRLEQLRPQELSRIQEPAPASGEKARLSEAPTGKKSLSMLPSIRGPAPKDIPVPLSHSLNGKSKPWEPFMAEEFAHQFHESVLQSTQKALQKHKGKEPARPHSLPVPVTLADVPRAPAVTQRQPRAWPLGNSSVPLGRSFEQILPQQAWGEAQESPFLTGAQVMPSEFSRSTS